MTQSGSRSDPLHHQTAAGFCRTPEFSATEARRLPRLGWATSRPGLPSEPLRLEAAIRGQTPQAAPTLWSVRKLPRARNPSGFPRRNGKVLTLRKPFVKFGVQFGVQVPAARLPSPTHPLCQTAGGLRTRPESRAAEPNLQAKPPREDYALPEWEGIRNGIAKRCLIVAEVSSCQASGYEVYRHEVAAGLQLGLGQ